MAEVVRTNFAPIVSDFENFHAHWCTNRPIVAPGASDKFQMIKSVLSTERAFLPGKKTLQTPFKLAYKHRRYLFLNNVTASRDDR